MNIQESGEVVLKSIFGAGSTVCKLQVELSGQEPKLSDSFITKGPETCGPARETQEQPTIPDFPKCPIPL